MDLIVAADKNWAIGKGGDLIYSIPEDMKFFRKTSLGKTVVMGRKTLESFPGGKPLKNRHNIVITRQNITIDGAEVVHGMEEALEKSKAHERCFVIGGASVFKEFYPLLTKVHLTKIDAAPFSDSFFPNLDEMEDWYIAEILMSGEENGIAYEMLLYRRK